MRPGPPHLKLGTRALRALGLVLDQPSAGQTKVALQLVTCCLLCARPLVHGSGGVRDTRRAG